ncbi:MAG: L,D-transpeptidase family protein [gamma proteobacterium symbiont of Taylorina sp.]|nr:L,D-transpeptidase family protein [gamma proteobacterium symbiont of Taylorina sp.]
MIMNKFIFQAFFLSFFLNSASISQATVFDLPAETYESLIGILPEVLFFTQAKQEDTLLDIARDYNLGQNEILLVNPDIDRWMPGTKAQILIPKNRLLPDTPGEGLTLNLPEYRLYYFSNDKKTVLTHPVSIGRQDWNTPLGKTKIVTKKKDPSWTPPKSIKEEHAEKGEILPDVVPAGPDNPLGLFALRLGLPGYLIHGTNKPYGVGMRVSHGCVRMYPEDIEKLFSQVRVGMPVYIVNQPVKVGWFNEKIYIEVHPQLEGEELAYEVLYDQTMVLIKEAFFKRYHLEWNNRQNKQLNLVIDAHSLRKALEQKNGLPIAITHLKKLKTEAAEELF